MKPIVRTSLYIMFILSITLFIFGCFSEGKMSNKANEKNSNEISKKQLELSTWVTDWQQKAALQDVGKMIEGLDSIQLFAAYFNDKDQLFYTEDMLKAIPELFKLGDQANLQSIDLTLVNDRFNGDGTITQKDTKLLTRLIQTPESRHAHIENIIGLVSQYNFQGVEVDYEKIPKDEWNKMALFYEELYLRLQEENKSLRIVLEPSAPIEKIHLPKGPTYILMAYNLFGNHSGPGPKADKAFIKKMTDKMSHLPGEPVIAFSTGGFSWSKNGKTKALTEVEAFDLSKRSSTEVQRDSDSGVLYFDYVETATSETRTVWYADITTLMTWIEVAENEGISRIALWRAGGFQQTTNEKINRRFE